ncbi:MAG: phytanoyl-CoA dioxygenase family protein [Desertimonas sp.]
MPADLDDARRQLLDDGAVRIEGLLGATWCQRLRDAIDRCRATPSVHYGRLSPDDSPRVDSDLFRWFDDPDLRDVTHDSPLVEAACGLLGTDAAVLVEDQWFASAPGATTPSPWHQDEPYYRLDRPFLTVWITLDDIDAECSLRVVPGSHTAGALFGMVEFSAGASTIERGGGLAEVPDIDIDPAAFGVRCWPMRAGDAIALDSRTLHATGRGALGSSFRRLSTRWADPATRYQPRTTGAAAFWDLLPHGLRAGDPLAGEVFPLIRGPRSSA